MVTLLSSGIHTTLRASLLPLTIALLKKRSAAAMSTTKSHRHRHSPSDPKPYIPPSWWMPTEPDGASFLPPNRLHLANLPTPVHEIPFPLTSPESSVLSPLRALDATLFVKRDDMTGGPELGGNKIRKLEFLLADALRLKCDSVVTIGGEQSNHVRATASSCRMVGLEPHVILRTRKTEDVGAVGNVMMDRLCGSRIYTCTPGEYGRFGSDVLVRKVCEELRTEGGKKPYGIPVGGSDGIGSFGYLEGAREVLGQLSDMDADVDHVVFATGSGGTATGIVLGMVLGCQNGKIPQMHAVGVCDDPDYFYKTMSSISEQMGFSPPLSAGGGGTEAFFRKHVIVHQGKGLGYARSTPQELEFLSGFAMETGIVLDPVYTGKALYHFLHNVVSAESEYDFQDSNVLFWHTGGALGVYDKEEELMDKARLKEKSPVSRLDMYSNKD